MKRSLKIGGGILLGLVVLGLLFGETEEAAEATAVAEETMPETETLPEVRAAELYAAYEENSVSADRDWKGKRVAVTGTISRIGRELFGKPFVILDSGPGMSGVQCVFPRAAKDAVAALSPDQHVTLAGEVQGKMGHVQMDGCEVP